MAKRHGRPSSIATNTTTAGCSGDGRTAEHGVFDVEGRDLASRHATGPTAYCMRDA